MCLRHKEAKSTLQITQRMVNIRKQAVTVKVEVMNPFYSIQ